MDTISITKGLVERVEAGKLPELDERDRKVVSYLANRFREGEAAARGATREADWTYTIWEWRF